jgi:uncharacterized protein (TIGR03118 family)
MHRRLIVLLGGLALVAAAATPAVAKNVMSENAFVVTVLQSDLGVGATPPDTDLVNGWGIAAGQTPWWVNDNGTGKSTLYNGNTGAKQGLVVSVTGANGPAAPTGIVFNDNPAFPVTAGGTDFARFIFDSEDGTVSAWKPGLTASVVRATSPDGAIYKGLAVGTVTAGGTTNAYLYATDFHHARVDVYDSGFALQHWAGAFVDPGIPAGFAPFGIQNIQGTIFVTYAKQDANAEDDVHGEGLGFVSAFGTDGSFQGRVASRGALNAPWGLAWAPGGWQRFGNNLLVGNFGDGRINGFAATSGGWEARGHLKLPNHHPLVVDGLWGIGFGNGGASGSPNALYFAAGPDDESHGQFGSITGQ